MAFGTTGQFEVTAAGREAFFEAVRGQIAFTDQHGGAGNLRQAMFAGANSGTYRLTTVYETGEARAAAIDALSTAESVPMRDFMARSPQGVTALGRALLNGVGESGASDSAVVFTVVGRAAAPGSNAAVDAAFATTRANYEALGIAANAFRTFAAGANSGRLVVGLGADSMSALSGALTQSLSGVPSGLGLLLATGGLEIEATTISRRVDL